MTLSKPAVAAAIALASAATGGVPLRAADLDVMVLANGDRLSGHVLEIGDDVIRFASHYGPVFEIPRSEVTGLIRAGTDPGETLPPEEDGPQPGEAVRAVDIGGRLTIGATAIGGKEGTVHADGEVTIDWGNRSVRLAGTLEEGITGGERSIDRQRLELRYEHDIAGPWYSALDGSLERDGFLDLRRRLTATASVGYYVIDVPGRQLAIDGGFAMLREAFADGRRETSPALRAAYRFSQDLFDERTAVEVNQELFVTIDSFRDYLLRSRAFLRHALSEDFEARFEVRHDYSTDAAPDQERDQVTYILGLGYTF